jgi:hypothetical protein
MACPYLSSGKYGICTVVLGSMAVSLWESRTYCTTAHPNRCPVYQQHEATQETVSPETALTLFDGEVHESSRRVLSIR